MGCGGSLPVASEFLVAQNGGTNANPLMPAPANLKMTGWTVSTGYTESEHTDGWNDEIEQMVDMVETTMRARAQRGVVRVPGEKPPEHLKISDGETDALIATLQMPPHLSLGIGATLIDPAGNVIAVLQSADFGGRRPTGMSTSAYCVYAGKPQYEGQPPDQLGRFLWATVTRKGFTYNCTVTNGAGVPSFNVSFASRMGWNHVSHKVKLTTSAAEGLKGVMLAGPSAEKPKRHNIQCADGGDPILYACIMYASALAHDEVENINRGGNDGGGGE